MRVGDDLFFAPEIRFPDVQLEGPLLAKQLKSRVEGFYLEPARFLIRESHAFGAGVLLVSVIDFLARLHRSSKELHERTVGDDFKAFVRELPSFGRSNHADRFYDEFRNGLIHEARIKNGGEFSLEGASALIISRGRLRINPSVLAGEVTEALEKTVTQIRDDAAFRDRFAQRLRDHFCWEFRVVEGGNAV